MLTNHHTKNQKRWRYMAALPLIALILLAFQAPVDPEYFSPVKVSTGISEASEAKPAGEIPSIFPLPEKYKEKITWGHNESSIDPISKKKRTHQGVDIPAPKGTAVYASSGGEVIKAELLEGWGNLIILEHAEGYTSHYAHLEGFKVKAGDKVTKGQLIATVGNTGRSTGPHLHYEVRKGGEKLNPADYY